MNVLYKWRHFTQCHASIAERLIKTLFVMPVQEVVPKSGRRRLVISIIIFGCCHLQKVSHLAKIPVNVFRWADVYTAWSCIQNYHRLLFTHLLNELRCCNGETTMLCSMCCPKPVVHSLRPMMGTLSGPCHLRENTINMICEIMSLTSYSFIVLVYCIMNLFMWHISPTLAGTHHWTQLMVLLFSLINVNII